MTDLPILEPTPEPSEAELILNEKGIPGIVTKIALAVVDGRPALAFTILTDEGMVQAIPTDPSGYLAPLATFEGRKARVVHENGNATYFLMEDEKAKIG